MIKNFIISYYDFFDRKLKHSTLVVFVISLIIIFVWIIFSSKNILNYSKSSIFDLDNKEIKQIIEDDIIIISWVKYRVLLEKLD